MWDITVISCVSWTINLSETVEYDVLHEMTTISQCVEP